MRTINLQTAYQLIITALLLGACLGLIGQRLSWLTGSPITAMEPNALLVQQFMPNATPGVVAPTLQTQDGITSKNTDATVQVEVEVHARGNANALARAIGPGDTEVKANTDGEGDGRSVAYIIAPEVPAWAPTPQGPTAALAAINSMAALTPIVGSAGAAMATVTEAIINLRSAPQLDSTVVGTASRGQQFTLVGRDAAHVWWLVCCHQEQPRWVHSAVVQITGDSTTVNVVTPQVNTTMNTIPALVPTPTIAPPMPTVTPPTQYEFMLTEHAQFEERITPRIFLYVYDGDEGLAGYTLRVRKDGQLLPVTQRSVAGLPGYTWPIPNERQRYTNLKVEFPTVDPAGVWEVQLVDANGRAVGPAATFHLQPNEPNQEMYVNYRQG